MKEKQEVMDKLWSWTKIVFGMYIGVNTRKIISLMPIKINLDPDNCNSDDMSVNFTIWTHFGSILNEDHSSVRLGPNNVRLSPTSK
jgi:hypothetical protein